MKNAPRKPHRGKATRDPPWISPGLPAAPDAVRRCGAQGQQGEVHFFLQRVNGGLYVEREETPRHGIRVCQSLLFNERASFERWHEDDPIRFEHPVLYRQLQRDAEALWGLEPPVNNMPR